MGHIFSEVFPFLSSVFFHWQIWLSGGGIGGFLVIAVTFIEKLINWKLSKRQHLLLFLVASFLCSCFLSWVDKDDALKASEVAKQDQRIQYSGELSKAQNEYGSLRADCAYQKGVVDTLGTQNRDQQTSINNCQNQALQLLKPLEARIITNSTLLYAIPPDSAHPSYSTAIVVGSVTRDYPAFKGFVECDTPFEIMQALLTQGVIGATSQSPSGLGKEEPISFSGANRRVGEPLFVLIHGEGLNPITCHIKSQ